MVWLLSEGKVYESIVDYYHTEDDLKKVLHLEKVINALENEINDFTNGAYSSFSASINNRDSFDHKYWKEIQDVYFYIFDLKAGKYYENEKYHRRGIPRIETSGKYLRDCLMCLIWKMDADLPSTQEEISEALKQHPTC